MKHVGIITLISMMALSATTGFAEKNYYEELSKGLNDLDKLKRFLIFNDYANETIQRLEKKEKPNSPPPQVLGSSTLVDELKITLSEVKKLSSPAPLKFKLNADFRKPGSANYRSGVNSSVQLLQKSKALLKQHEQILKQLDSDLELVNAVHKASSKLGNDLGTLADELSSTPVLDDILGYAAYDLLFIYTPKVVELRDHLEKLDKSIATQFKQDQISYDNFKSNTDSVIMGAEAEWINSEEKKLKANADSIRSAQKQLDKKSEAARKAFDEWIANGQTPKSDGKLHKQKSAEIKKEQDEIYNQAIAWKANSETHKQITSEHEKDKALLAEL